MAAWDLERVMEIAESLPQAPRWPKATYEAAIAVGVLQRRRIALVAEGPLDGKVVGFAVAALTPPESELESIAVASAFQRRGVARQLFQRMANALRREMVDEVVLEVRVSNHSAQTVYRSLGFAEVGLRSDYYSDPVEDALVMRLTLD
ncbi:MAG TPA: ribosomal protein S18-alanine N-acetyltransferase [Terracidiphilus sp.]|nr:ribosomal protein S18-alanine N-acetyltransferase [Terracidiphilus sp.]